MNAQEKAMVVCALHMGDERGYLSVLEAGYSLAGRDCGNLRHESLSGTALSPSLCSSSSSSLPVASTASITIFQINKYVPDVLDTYHMKNTLE